MKPNLDRFPVFGFNFTPCGWEICYEQVLPINSNTFHFLLFRTIYSGFESTIATLYALSGRSMIQSLHRSGLATVNCLASKLILPLRNYNLNLCIPSIIRDR
jgi:microcystin-dependent protein